MTQQRLETCAWCPAPATHEVVVQPANVRKTAKGEVVASLPRTLPACQEHYREITAHNRERAAAHYRQIAQINGAQQQQLW